MDKGIFKGYTYLFVTILIFSTMEVVSATLKGLIHPFQLTFIRFFIGGITLLPLVLIKKEKILLKDALFIAALGILNTCVSMGCYQIAVNMGKASTAAIILSANPVFVVFLSTIILGEKVTRDRILCILLGVLGIILIMYKPDSSSDSFLSLFLALVGSITFALYTVLGKKKSDSISSITMISLSSIFGSAFYIPVLLAMKLPILYIPQGSIIKILYLGIVLSGISYVTFIEGLKILGAGKGSMVFFLKPGIVAILAMVFLKEVIDFKAIIGMILVIGGVLVNFIYTNRGKIINSNDNKNIKS